MLNDACAVKVTKELSSFIELSDERVKTLLLPPCPRSEDVLLVLVHDHVDGPPELLPLCLVVNLLDGDLVLLTPRHADPDRLY